MSSLLSIPGPVLSLTFLTIPVLISQYARFQQASDFVTNLAAINLPDNTVYDFIVVGGGSGGATVANRLSAPPNNYKVLLLEAGGDPNWVSYIPATDFMASDNPQTDWKYLSQPQRNCSLAMKKNQIKLQRGKSLGGSSAVNFMVYLRGAQAGFDEWADLTGDPSWSADAVLPLFQKSENYKGNYPNPAVHGTGGPLYVDKSEYHPTLEPFLETLDQYGYPERDVNDNQTDSWMRMDSTTNNGVRWSTYSAFIRPILKRKNFVVCRYCHVNRLIFDSGNRRAVIGVAYTRHNNTFPKYAFASKEVILSAGAFNTPQILMLSGIGPRDHLRELGIPTIVHNPNVGKHLQDHPATLIPIVFNNGRGLSLVADRDFLSDTLQSYDDFKEGPLSANNILAAGYTSTELNEDPNFPDIQMLLCYAGTSTISTLAFNQLYNFKKRTFDRYVAPFNGKDGNYIIVSQEKPRSRGTVRLASRNPKAKPIINLRYFTDPENYDLKSLVAGLKFSVEFYEKSAAYQRIGATLPPNKFPGCEKYELRTDDYYECYIRQFTTSLWHYSGTCKMGRGFGDPLAVVDPQLRVIGVSRLRVADASVMPKVTNGNTNAPTIMIGEKAAEMILRTWGNRASVATSSEENSFFKLPKFPFDFQDFLGIGLGAGPGVGPQSKILKTGKPKPDKDGQSQDGDVTENPITQVLLSEDDDEDEDGSDEELFPAEPFCKGSKCSVKINKDPEEVEDDDEESQDDDEDDPTEDPALKKTPPSRKKKPHVIQFDPFTQFPEDIYHKKDKFRPSYPYFSPEKYYFPIPKDYQHKHHQHYPKPNKKGQYFQQPYWPPGGFGYPEYYGPFETHQHHHGWGWGENKKKHDHHHHHDHHQHQHHDHHQHQHQSHHHHHPSHHDDPHFYPDYSDEFCSNSSPLPPWQRFYFCPVEYK